MHRGTIHALLVFLSLPGPQGSNRQIFVTVKTGIFLWLSVVTYAAKDQ